MKKIEWSEKSNPYQEVIDILTVWSMNHHFEDMIVRISLNGEETNEILLCDGTFGCDYYFNNDWWEGEKDVYLVGFCPLYDIGPEMRWKEI